MKKSTVVVMLLAALPVACAKQEPAPSPAQQSGAAGLTTEDEKTAYAAGVMLGNNLKPLSLKPAELEAAKRGLQDAASGKTPAVDMPTYQGKLQALIQARASAGAQGEKDKGKAFCESAAKDQGAVTTPSGLVFRSLQPGKGASPKPTDGVRVHYRGTLIDGTEFDSSIARGQPAEFALNGVIPCWTEGLQKMKVGEKARLVCPSSIAYGDQGRPGIPGGATLVFEVELLDIAKK
jgi:FKBP-type peptidyl-prolyl cis-trans isomerase FkpA